MYQTKNHVTFNSLSVIINSFKINYYHGITKHMLSTDKRGNCLPKSFRHQLNSYFWHPKSNQRVFDITYYFTFNSILIFGIQKWTSLPKKLSTILWGFFGHYIYEILSDLLIVKVFLLTTNHFEFDHKIMSFL